MADSIVRHASVEDVVVDVSVAAEEDVVEAVVIAAAVVVVIVGAVVVVEEEEEEEEEMSGVLEAGVSPSERRERRRA